MQKNIYFDHNATTPLDPRVIEAILEELNGPPANPSSAHLLGQRAKKALQRARSQCAKLFQISPQKVIFTSGATEAINLFLRSLGPSHIVTTKIEHAAIFETLNSIDGFQITYVPVSSLGAPDPEEIQKAIQKETKALIFSSVNSETGVKIDLKTIAKIAEEKNIALFIDAVAHIGKEPFEFYPGITAIAISAHKFHGPKGVGALLLNQNFPLKAQITGGGQEQKVRSGTENLAAIIGMQKALEILDEEQDAITEKLSSLRDRFEKALTQTIEDVSIQGEGPRISNTSNVAFKNVDAETLLIELDRVGIYASQGSACSSSGLEPSRVLREMGLDPKTVRSSIRFSFSRMNTEEEIDFAAQKIKEIVEKIRSFQMSLLETS